MSAVLVLGCLLSSCGGNDAGPELGGSDVEPSAEETSPEDGASDPEEPGDDAEATAEPEPSPTPVPASSDGPAQNWPEPEIPAEIYEETEEGALAALEYWLEARTFLQLTGDARPLLSASSEDCAFCAVAVEQYEYVYGDESGWYVSDRSTVEDAKVSDVREGFDTGVFFDLREAEFSVYDQAGEVLGSGGGEIVSNVEAHVEYVESQWIVLDIYAPSSGE
ncbi:hypothetical protein I2485_08285 [Nesterenkonia sp. E16_7]|uniref:DUF6318 family protein n=1 Tax=unclassified Nesterenkonia TaxID=2629769 RepID=UPI001A91C9B3|nr:hypothetical protein [Nesterenkonia sp. E16_10]MBO0598651.1 hypothetical protein [Nesterenkonia sp. E16_7]